MKRECTEVENRIIKGCGKDILTRPETYKAMFRSSMIPVFLGIFAGLALGAAAALLFSVSAESWIRLIMLFCIAITVELFVLLWRACSKGRKRKKRLPGDKFWVNGGTVIKYISHSEDGPLLVFAEDDLYDNIGNPCSIVYPASYCLDVTPGERILLVYSDSGAYIPLRLTERTRSIAAEYGPESFEGVNWNEAVSLPHPAAINLDQSSSMMNEYERAEVVKKCNRLKSIRSRNWLGIILMSLLLLFLAAITFVLLVAGEVIKELSEALVFVAIVLSIWLLLTCCFAKLVLAGNIRGLKKIHYKKKVMFCSVNDTYEKDYYEKYIAVFEYVNGVVELVEYPVTNNYFLPKKMAYGNIIYKYSQDAKSCAKDHNIFCLME